MSSKGGIVIENNVLKLKKLLESKDKEKIKEILNEILDLRIDQIEYDTNLQLSNISEYEFELIKIKAILETDDEVEMYLKMIKNTVISANINNENVSTNIDNFRLKNNGIVSSPLSYFNICTKIH